MGGTGRDLFALIRSLGFAGFVPSVKRRAVCYVDAYDRVVRPLVESAVEDLDRRARIDVALCAAGTKLGFLLAGYTTMAGVPFRSDVASLAGAATRLYDDLFDEFGSDELDRRLTVLFSGGPFVPRFDVERLLYAVYLELDRRLGRERDDPVYAALLTMHDYEIRSRRQQDPAIPASTLAHITEGKGGQATVVLFGLMRPAMSEHELELVRKLGGVLQLLDDYQDVALDQRAGVTTAATRGEVTLAHICRQLREIRPSMRRYYGRVEPFFAVVYAVLWFSFLRRRWPRLGTGGRTAATPLGVLLLPGDNLIQRAKDRRHRNGVAEALNKAPRTEDG